MAAPTPDLAPDLFPDTASDLAADPVPVRPASPMPNDEAILPLLRYLEYESAPMIVVDGQYNILGANVAYQRQFGIDGRAPIGRKCYQVSHHFEVPCDQAGELCPMRRAVERCAPERSLHVHHTPRGTEHVDIELRPLLDEHGGVIAFVERLETVRSASSRPSRTGLVGQSAAFKAALLAVQRIGPSSMPALLLGESGTGKELFAQAVHDASDRAHGPFVVVDCSSLPEALFETELFGHEKGAFTGAAQRKTGLVETAHGGTLFLDEIGDVPLSVQVKLLRLVESGTYRRVGGLEVRHADFRLVAATHQPLAQRVLDGRLRQDLYYRISALPIELPALRDRRDDLPLLVESLLRRSSAQQPPCRVADDAMQRLIAHDWPGNIRELRNVLERARLYADNGLIEARHLPAGIGDTGAAPPACRAAAIEAGLGGPRRLSDEDLLRAADDHPGSRRALAARLGISERTLYRRLRRLRADGPG